MVFDTGESNEALIRFMSACLNELISVPPSTLKKQITALKVDGLVMMSSCNCPNGGY